MEYDDNGNELSSYSEEYRKKYHQKYYRQNSEKSYQYNKEYRLTLKGKFKDCKKGAKSRNLEFSLTFEQFCSLVSKICVYCGSVDVGIDRIDSNKSYTLENCNPCCFQCNIAKNTFSEDEFLNWIKKVYQYRISK
jgi:5-methylcytosine-specific restriction endonuclease McrA